MEQVVILYRRRKLRTKKNKKIKQENQNKTKGGSTTWVNLRHEITKKIRKNEQSGLT